MIDLQLLLKAEDLGSIRQQLVADISCIDDRYGSYERVIECDWRVAVENALEDLHVPTIHRDTFHKLQIRQIGLVRQGRHSAIAYSIDNERVVKQLRHMARWVPHAVPSLYTHVFIFPNMCFASVGGFTYAMQTYQEHEEGTYLISRLYVPRLAARAPNMNWFFSQALDFNKRVFDEDADCCERVTKWGGDQDILGPGEERIVWFREALCRG